MATRLNVLLAVVFLTLLTACLPVPQKAPLTDMGNHVVIYFHLDIPKIDKTFSEYEIKHLYMTASYMEQDMFKMLQKAGYGPSIIRKRSEYRAKEGSYLLMVKITAYDPGPEMFIKYIGFDAGSVYIETHYELYADGKQPILVDYAASGRGDAWEDAMRQIEVTIIDDISDHLRRAYTEAKPE